MKTLLFKVPWLSQAQYLSISEFFIYFESYKKLLRTPTWADTERAALQCTSPSLEQSIQVIPGSVRTTTAAGIQWPNAPQRWNLALIFWLLLCKLSQRQFPNRRQVELNATPQKYTHKVSRRSCAWEELCFLAAVRVLGEAVCPWDAPLSCWLL